MTDFASRRAFLQLAATGAGTALFAPELLAASGKRVRSSPPVLLNYNENPLGPCTAARKAILDSIALSGRYQFELTTHLVKTIAGQEGLKPEYVLPFSGSSEPLQYLTLAHTGPKASLVMADPTFEAAGDAAALNDAKVHKVPLAADYAHDVEAMLAVDKKAGLVLVCNPNNPTGSVTPRAAIEYALAHKPSGSLLLVDEAYIHYSEQKSVMDLVAADGELVVLRTFSKLYGMAGLRCGYAAGRPDLLARLKKYGNNPLPVPAVMAAIASLQDPAVVAKRRQQNADLLKTTCNLLIGRGYKVTPSQANCFMVDVQRPGRDFTAAMAARGVVIGRSWPSWPNWVRVTVGTRQEMSLFLESFFAVARQPATIGSAFSAQPPTLNHVPHWA